MASVICDMHNNATEQERKLLHLLIGFYVKYNNGSSMLLAARKHNKKMRNVLTAHKIRTINICKAGENVQIRGR
jgi:hydrogenase maturation factor